MTTYILNTENECVSQSRNLRGLFEWARRGGGVVQMTCHIFPETDASYPLSPNAPRSEWVKASRPTGFLVVSLRNGYKACTWFVCGSHLTDWAHGRAKVRRNSWFSGAKVDVINHDQWRDMQTVFLAKGATE